MNEEQLIQEQFKKLPPNLQRAITESDWKTPIMEVGQNHSLNQEQSGVLERETMLVIYGFEDPRSYISNITKEVGTTEEISTEIANEIAEKVLNIISIKADEFEKTTPNINTPSVPEIAPEIHPMIEAGEVVHEVPHIEHPVSSPQSTPIVAEPTKTESPAPASAPESTPYPHYPGGVDPYREPLN